MATGQRIDPFFSYNFLVELDSVVRASFQEASGLEATIDPIEYREGGQNTTVRKLPGVTKYSNIVLKRGLTTDSDLYDWHRQTVLGSVDFRRNGSIIVLDRQGSEVARWDFVDAWPTKYQVSDFKSTGNEVAIETLELVHEGIERKLG
jgi:phage tail-like protein